MSNLKHSEYCTFESCASSCEVRRAKFAASVASAKRSAIRMLVDELGHYATQDKLTELGWPPDAVHAAVRRGDVIWTAQGTLQVPE